MSMQIRANSYNVVANRKQEVAFGVIYKKKNLVELGKEIAALLVEAKPMLESFEKKHKLIIVVGDNELAIKEKELPINVFEKVKKLFHSVRGDENGYSAKKISEIKTPDDIVSIAEDAYNN